jgi:hypothetical protein
VTTAQDDPRPQPQPAPPPSRWRRLAEHLLGTPPPPPVSPGSALMPVPDSPAVLDGDNLPPPPPEPVVSTPDALAHEVLVRALAAAPLHRHPTGLHYAALVATVREALRVGGWRAPDLAQCLSRSRWDTDQTRPSYVLLRERLTRLAPAAGYWCPQCQNHTVTSKNVRPERVAAGWCATCRSHTGDG